MATVERRFWAKVRISESPDGCLEWTAAKTRGYGAFGVGRKTVRAHRFSYELLVGLVPAGLQLDHLCRNRACVRPDHLEPVTPRENVRRGRAAERESHCLRGHESTEENTYRSGGTPQCRACALYRANARYAAKRER